MNGESCLRLLKHHDIASVAWREGIFRLARSRKDSMFSVLPPPSGSKPKLLDLLTIPTDISNKNNAHLGVPYHLYVQGFTWY